MARAIANCTCRKCGKKFEKIASKNSRDEANRWTEWAEANITLCYDCYKAESYEQAKGDMELPELEGSPKQIAWAEDIRDKFIENTANRKNKLYNATRAYIVRNINSAKWWIDHRYDYNAALNEVYAANMEAIKEEAEK